MIKTRFRALVLAAGRGERLRPLTDSVPKPLLPIAGQAVAGHTLDRLRRSGCEAAALNLHHLGEAVRAHFGDAFDGMRLRYSEESVLQGTLGALYPLREFLADAEAVVLLNGDSYCRWPIEALVRRHLRSGAEATLLVLARSRTDEPRAVTIDAEGRVVGLRGQGLSLAVGELRRRVFAGAHVLSPALLSRIAEGPGDIIAGLYQPLLRDGGRIAAVETRRRWHDLGRPARYLAAALDVGVRRWWGRHTRVAPGASVERPARLRRSVVERGARIERGARLDRTLALGGSRIGPGCRLRDSIVGFGAVLPPGTSVERRLITPRGKEPPPAGATVVGDLVFTPLDG